MGMYAVLLACSQYYIHLTCWLEGNSGFGHRLFLNSYRMFAWGIEHFAYDSNFGFA